MKIFDILLFRRISIRTKIMIMIVGMSALFGSGILGYVYYQLQNTLRDEALNKALILADGLSVKAAEPAVYPVVSVIRNIPEIRTPINALLPKRRDIDVFDRSEFTNVEVQRQMLKLLPENLWGFLLSAIPSPIMK